MIRRFLPAFLLAMMVSTAASAQEPADVGRFTGVDRKMLDAARASMDAHPALYFYVCPNAFNQQVLRASRRPLARPGGRHPDRPAPAPDLVLGGFGGRPSDEAVRFLRDRCQTRNAAVADAPPGAARPPDPPSPRTAQPPARPPGAAPAAAAPAAVLRRRSLHPAKVIQALPALNRVEAMVFSANGDRLLTWTVSTVVVWDLTRNGVTFETLRHPEVNRLAAPGAGLFSLLPRGEAVAGRSTPQRPLDRFIPKGPPSQTHDMKTGAKRGGLRVPEAYTMTQLATSVAPDGSHIAVLGLATETAGRAQAAPGALAQQVVVANARTGAVRFRLYPFGKPDAPRAPAQAPATVWATAFSNDGQYLAAATSDGALVVWDMRRGTEAAVFRCGGPYRRLDGRESLVWLGGHDSIIVPANTPVGFVRCDLATKTVAPLSAARPQQVGVPFGPKEHDTVAISPDGTRMIRTSREFPDRLTEQTLLIVDDLTTGKSFGRIPGIAGDRAWSLRFSPDSQRLAIGTALGDVLIYRVADLEKHARDQSPLSVPAR